MNDNKNYILITGGAGFIGSNYINLNLDQGDSHIVNLDKLTYAGNPDNVSAKDALNYTLVQGDIVDQDLVKRLFEKYRFTKVINFAAESHVDNSISNPGAFVETNLT